MRLVSLTVRNFRGFGSSGTAVPLDADLVLMFGPNGFGKTSLAEAIEWLFYGTTKRRERGDGYSKIEYAGSFANAHGGTPVQVEATVLLGDKQIKFTRRITSGAASDTLIDAAAAA